jgi:VIT1/CCC1 family predicted Fe2+/Mn2+ transporter
VKHGISLDEPRIIPIFSALTTAIAFALGGSVPLLSAFFAPDEWRVVVTFVAVTLSLCVTSIVEAYGSRLRAARVVTRTVGVGMFVMVVTFLGGTLFEIRSE